LAVIGVRAASRCPLIRGREAFFDMFGFLNLVRDDDGQVFHGENALTFLIKDGVVEAEAVVAKEMGQAVSWFMRMAGLKKVQSRCCSCFISLR